MNKELLSILITCIDAETGEILYQNNRRTCLATDNSFQFVDNCYKAFRRYALCGRPVRIHIQSRPPIKEGKLL